MVVHKGFTCTLIYNPQTGGAPGVFKQFRDATLHFGRSDFELGNITYTTELSESTTSDVIAAPGTVYTAKNLRRLVPQDKQRATQLNLGFTIREARGDWHLHGYSVTVDGASERVSR
jgi:hypothetical protein